MADQVIVYWVTFKGAIYKANMAAGTYQVMSSPDRLGATQRALDRAGIPHKSWEGEPATMEEFGVEILEPNELWQRFVQRPVIKSKVNDALLSLEDILGFMNLDLYNIANGNVDIKVQKEV